MFCLKFYSLFPFPIVFFARFFFLRAKLRRFSSRAVSFLPSARYVRFFAKVCFEIRIGWNLTIVRKENHTMSDDARLAVISRLPNAPSHRATSNDNKEINVYSSRNNHGVDSSCAYRRCRCWWPAGMLVCRVACRTCFSLAIGSVY